MEREHVIAGILQQLCAGYGCEIELYGKVRDLARRQTRLLRAGANGLAVLQLSSEKEQFLENIGDIDEALAPARTIVTHEHDLIADGLMDGLHAVLDQLDAVIDEIRALEWESYGLVTRQTQAERRRPAAASLPN